MVQQFDTDVNLVAASLREIEPYWAQSRILAARCAVQALVEAGRLKDA